MQQRSDNAILPYIAAAGIILFTPIFFILARLGLQDRPAAREDRRGLGAEPGRGGAPRRGRVDPPLPDCERADRRRVDHLPELPDTPRTASARTAAGWSGIGLVAVRLVRQGLRAPRGARRRPPSRRCRAVVMRRTDLGDDRHRTIGHRPALPSSVRTCRPEPATGDRPDDPGIRAGSAARALSSSGLPPDPPSREAARTRHPVREVAAEHCPGPGPARSPTEP